MERLSKLEILNETVQFYSEDVSRRSKTIGACVYNGDNNNHCSVGRCFLPEFKEQGKNLNNNYECDIETFIDNRNVFEEVPTTIDDLLEERYRGHELEFWTQLQRLHDMDKHWDFEGLSELGKYKVKDIKEQFGL